MEKIKMRTEVPTLQRCCFCIPLRYGLIAWGYLKLILASVLLAIIGVSMKKIGSELPNDSVPPMVYFITLCSVLDILMSCTYVVGCHMKNVKIIRLYYYYSQVLLAIVLLTNVYTFGLSIYQMSEYLGRSPILWSYLFSELIFMIANIGTQIYMILLIRSEVIKLKNGQQFSFENRTTEAICTMNI